MLPAGGWQVLDGPGGGAEGPMGGGGHGDSDDGEDIEGAMSPRHEEQDAAR